jgi:hypothetical protein
MLSKSSDISFDKVKCLLWLVGIQQKTGISALFGFGDVLDLLSINASSKETWLVVQTHLTLIFR